MLGDKAAARPCAFTPWMRPDSRLPSCCDGRRSACCVLPPRAPTASLFRPDWLS